MTRFAGEFFDLVAITPIHEVGSSSCVYQTEHGADGCVKKLIKNCCASNGTVFGWEV